MPEDVDYAFHARVLIDNPAFRRAMNDERDAIVRELHRLEPWQREERWAVSVALTAADNLERRLRRMATNKGQIEHFHAEQMRSAV